MMDVDFDSGGDMFMRAESVHPFEQREIVYGNCPSKCQLLRAQIEGALILNDTATQSLRGHARWLISSVH